MEEIRSLCEQLFGTGTGGSAAYLIFRILLAICILFIGSRLINLFCRLALKSVKRSDADQSAMKFLNSVLKAALYLILILAILNGFGYRANSVLTLLGSLGLAIVLSVRDSMSNVASGIMILLTKPFKVGDYILEYTNGSEGTVVSIDLFFTKIRTIEGCIVVLPNMLLTGNSIENMTTEPYRVLDLTCLVAYDSNIERAKEILHQILESDPDVIRKEKIAVFVKDLKERAVLLGYRADVTTEAFWPVRHRVQEAVAVRFHEEGIALGYPQYLSYTDDRTEDA